MCNRKNVRLSSIKLTWIYDDINLSTFSLTLHGRLTFITLLPELVFKGKSWCKARCDSMAVWAAEINFYWFTSLTTFITGSNVAGKLLGGNHTDLRKFNCMDGLTIVSERGTVSPLSIIELIFAVVWAYFTWGISQNVKLLTEDRQEVKVVVYILQH